MKKIQTNVSMITNMIYDTLTAKNNGATISSVEKKNFFFFFYHFNDIKWAIGLSMVRIGIFRFDRKTNIHSKGNVIFIYRFAS